METIDFEPRAQLRPYDRELLSLSMDVRNEQGQVETIKAQIDEITPEYVIASSRHNPTGVLGGQTIKTVYHFSRDKVREGTQIVVKKYEEHDKLVKTIAGIVVVGSLGGYYTHTRRKNRGL